MADGPIITRLSQITPKALREIEMWLEPWFRTKSMTVINQRFQNVGPTSYEQIASGGSVNALSTGVKATLKWAHSSGARLLDYSDPRLPTVISAGTYAFTIIVIKNDAVFGDAGQMYADMYIDANGDQNITRGLCLLNTLVGTGPDAIAPPLVTLSITRDVVAGATLLCEVAQSSGVTRPFVLGGVIEKLA